MARLTAEQWEQARAEYEVRGLSLTQVAKTCGVDRAAVSRRAKNHGWVAGKSHALVEKKIIAITLLAETEMESHALTPVEKFTIEKVVQERLQTAGVLATFGAALVRKGIHILETSVETPEQWVVMTRGRKNLASGKYS